MEDLDDDVVRLLNQQSPFSSYRQRTSRVEEFELHPEDLYLDENGLPTDKFLDSLKHDFLMTNDIDDITSSIRESSLKSMSKSRHSSAKQKGTHLFDMSLS
jgi:hypothetical protein